MINEKKIKIALVDDHLVIRAGLARQLASDKSIKVVLEAKNGADFLQQLQTANDLPDIAVVDIKMPVMDGFDLTEQLKTRYPDVRVLVLSAFSSDYNIANMISKGVRGYITKSCSPSEFKSAIHAIYEDGYYFSGVADERTFKMFHQNNIKPVEIPEREMEFLKLCCSELLYVEIAEKMGISERTLNGCRVRLFERLGVNSRIGLVLFAMRSGLHINS